MPFDIFHQPKNTMPKIESIYAFVSVDPADGNEGVCAASIGGSLMPLIAADEARLQQLIPIAEGIANLLPEKIKLVKFTAREEIREIEPITRRAP